MVYHNLYKYPSLPIHTEDTINVLLGGIKNPLSSSSTDPKIKEKNNKKNENSRINNSIIKKL